MISQPHAWGTRNTTFVCRRESFDDKARSASASGNRSEEGGRFFHFERDRTSHGLFRRETALWVGKMGQERQHGLNRSVLDLDFLAFSVDLDHVFDPLGADDGSMIVQPFQMRLDEIQPVGEHGGVQGMLFEFEHDLLDLGFNLGVVVLVREDRSGTEEIILDDPHSSPNDLPDPSRSSLVLPPSSTLLDLSDLGDPGSELVQVGTDDLDLGLDV
jgi:hypothetical protein